MAAKNISTRRIILCLSGVDKSIYRFSTLEKGSTEQRKRQKNRNEYNVLVREDSQYRTILLFFVPIIGSPFYLDNDYCLTMWFQTLEAVQFKSCVGVTLSRASWRNSTFLTIAQAIKES